MQCLLCLSTSNFVSPPPPLQLAKSSNHDLALAKAKASYDGYTRGYAQNYEFSKEGPIFRDGFPPEGAPPTR